MLALAGFLADRPADGDAHRRATSAWPGAVLLVFVQPDLGTALVYMAALAAILFCRGALADLTLLSALLVIVVMGVLWCCRGRRARADAYQAGGSRASHPDDDPAADIQRHAVEHGDRRRRPGGRGVTGASQTTLDYLPEHATDFVFAALSEERGFLGAPSSCCSTCWWSGEVSG